MIKGMLFTEYNEVEDVEFVRTMERNEGRAEGKTEANVEALVNLMHKLCIPFEKAAEILNIPKTEYDIYQKAIAQI